MSTTGPCYELTNDPGGGPEALPVCRPEREDSIGPLLVIGAVALLIRQIRRSRARRRAPSRNTTRPPE